MSYFAEPIGPRERERFGAQGVGDSTLNTCWEALAVLVALRTWRRVWHLSARVELRGDSLAVLRAVAAGRSKSPNVSTILREIALDEAELGDPLAGLVHIPGAVNCLPDALSRLWATEPAPFPAALRGVPRATPQPRDRGFWRAAGDPEKKCAEKERGDGRGRRQAGAAPAAPGLGPPPPFAVRPRRHKGGARQGRRQVGAAPAAPTWRPPP